MCQAILKSPGTFFPGANLALPVGNERGVRWLVGSQALVEKHCDVHVAQPVGLPVGHGSEQVGNHDAGLAGEVGSHGLGINGQPI